MHKFIRNKMKKSYHSVFFSSIVMIFFFLEGRPVSGVVCKFKCLLKKTRSFCPCSSALNRSGKGLKGHRGENSIPGARRLN